MAQWSLNLCRYKSHLLNSGFATHSSQFLVQSMHQFIMVARPMLSIMKTCEPMLEYVCKQLDQIVCVLVLRYKIIYLSCSTYLRFSNGSNNFPKWTDRISTQNVTLVTNNISVNYLPLRECMLLLWYLGIACQFYDKIWSLSLSICTMDTLYVFLWGSGCGPSWQRGPWFESSDGIFLYNLLLTGSKGRK